MVAVADGHREETEWWLDVLRDLIAPPLGLGVRATDPPTFPADAGADFGLSATVTATRRPTSCSPPGTAAGPADAAGPTPAAGFG